MDEPKTDLAVLKTYSLNMDTIGKIAVLAERLNMSKGAVVRLAIDTLYAENTQTVTQPA